MSESLAFSTEIGLIAGAFFVIGLALLNFGVVTADSVLYQSLNFLGAIGFVYTAISPFNPGLFITEAVWAIVAVFGVWKIYNNKKKKQDRSTQVA
ncbi:CBU_0592 family membrane protein [Corynebacterium sp. S7]